MNFLGLKFTTKELFIVGGVLVGGAYVLTELKPEIANKVDITHPDNFINSGFTKIYQGVTGSNQMLGEDIFDIFHPKKEIEKIETPPAYESVDPVYNIFDFEQMGA